MLPAYFEQSPTLKTPEAYFQMWVWSLLHSWRIVLMMGQSFGNQLTLVEVVTDSSTGIPKRQLWVAAAKPDQAVTLVLCAVPVGWTALIADGRLTPEQEAILNLQPGEVRELTK